jgi:hypothetical protein
MSLLPASQKFRCDITFRDAVRLPIAEVGGKMYFRYLTGIVDTGLCAGGADGFQCERKVCRTAG